MPRNFAAGTGMEEFGNYNIKEELHTKLFVCTVLIITGVLAFAVLC